MKILPAAAKDPAAVRSREQICHRAGPGSLLWENAAQDWTEIQGTNVSVGTLSASPPGGSPLFPYRSGLSVLEKPRLSFPWWPRLSPPSPPPAGPVSPPSPGPRRLSSPPLVVPPLPLPVAPPSPLPSSSPAQAPLPFLSSGRGLPGGPRRRQSPGRVLSLVGWWSFRLLFFGRVGSPPQVFSPGCAALPDSC